MEREEERGSI